MRRNILFISAHPDDETLGAGGTILKHREFDDKIAWLIVTKMTESQGFTKESIIRRQKEIQLVSNKYNFDEVYQLDFPTMTLSPEYLTHLISDISDVFNNFKPEKIYTVYRYDAHSDHKIVFDAVAACSKSFRYPYIREVLAYECLSETEFAVIPGSNQFKANCFIDISNHIDEKIEIMKIYSSEMGVHPFPRSEKNIRALATYRGATAGVEFAEAFQILKSYRFETL